MNEKVKVDEGQTPQLGDRVIDVVSCYRGIMTAQTVWLNGCVRCCIVAETLEDGRPIEIWIDIQQLQVIQSAVVPFVKAATKRPEQDGESLHSLKDLQDPLPWKLPESRQAVRRLLRRRGTQSDEAREGGL